MNIRAFGRLLSSSFALPKLAFRESNFLPEPKPKSLFEALRSKRFVRRMGVGLVLVMGSSFAALQVSATTQLGSDSLIDYTANFSATDTSRIVGRSDSTTVTVPTGTDPYSVQLWVNPGAQSASASSSNRVLINLEKKFVILSDQGRWFYLRGDGNAWVNGGAGVDTGVAVLSNRWTHISLVFTSSNTLFYVDGQLRHSSGSRSNSGAGSTVAYMGIGGWTPGNQTQSQLFDGQVDEVKLWNTDRSTTITTDMHARQVGAAGLQHYWDFNEGSGTTIHDRIGSVNLTSSSVVFSDVKQVSSASDGDTLLTFARTYLPALGGWTVPASATNFRALVVAGGGAGGNTSDNPGAGGGGAGGYIEASTSLTPGAIVSAIVGQGGQRNTLADAAGRSGQNSNFASFTAVGGGGGGGRDSRAASANRALSGGSGGGAGGRFSDSLGGSGTEGQGNKGGDQDSGGDTSSGGRGGGGALTAGSNGTGGGTGGAGGTGKTSTVFGGTYAAGGSGGTGNTTSAVNLPPADANSGDGGKGASAATGANRSGASGGSGIVMVRYTPTIDNAIVLTGSENSYLQTSGQLINNNAFTVELWAYLGGGSGFRNIVRQQASNDSNSRLYLALDASNQLVAAWGGATAQTIPALQFTMPLNEWTHLALTRSSTGVAKLYVNGSLLANLTGTNLTSPSSSTFAVGAKDATGIERFVGQLDQVKVWHSELSDTQVAASMHAYGATQANNTAVASGASLIAHYDFNGYEPGIEPNRSGSGIPLIPQSAIASGSYTDSAIVSRGTAHGLQTYLRFNRSYLTAAGGWTSPSSMTRYKALVVAGGGGGGGGPSQGGGNNHHVNGGGGGAGGLLESDAQSSTGGAVIAVKVGQGGLGTIQGPTNANTASASTNGGNSTLGDMEAIGGGAGGYMPSVGNITAAKTGGSGGGGGAQAVDGADVSGKSGTVGQGNRGGNGFTWNSSFQGAGGGGGAGGEGVAANSSTRTSGAGGAGKASSITGSRIMYAGGGGGGSRSDTAGAAGSGGGGAGGLGAAGSRATANLGGGGGGGSSSGGSGGSGVVILSYGASMDVTQTPGGARAGSTFQRPITVQLKDQFGQPYTGAAQQVTLTASSSTVLRQTVNGSTSNVTSVTVTSSGGVATFADIGFQIGVTGAQTLTVTADAFVGTSLSVTPNFLPTAVTISDRVSSDGSFVDGSWVSTSAVTSNIQASALARELATRDVIIEVLGTSSDTTSGNGSVIFQAPVTKTAGSDRTITIKATKNVYMDTKGISSTSSKLNVILWLDSDSTNGGQAILNRPASGYLVDTNGGHLSIGGGSDSTLWNGLTIPSGYAQANNSFGTSWWGIELGVNQNVSNLQLIRTSGGNLRLYGDSNSGEVGTTMVYGIAWEGGEINTGTGSVEFNGKTSRETITNTAGSLNYGVAIGIQQQHATDIPRLVTTGSVSITGTTGDLYAGHQGVYVAYADFNSTTAAISITSDRRVELGTSNKFASPVTVTSAANVLVSGSQTINSSSTATSLRLTSSGANVVVQGPISATGGVETSAAAATTLTSSLQASGNILVSGSGNITTSSSADITSTSGSVSITSTGATLTLDRSVSAASAISLTANRMALGATIGTTTASGVVTIAPQSVSRVVNLGTEDFNHLSLTSSELNRVSAGTLRIGALGGNYGGQINVTAAIAPTGVSTLALRTTGNVVASGSGSITEVNLAISATFIDLQGNNSITGNLALSSGHATLNYNQISGSFTPATVDQIAPEYGVATQMLMSQVPTSTAVDRMMAVAFNPPPLATLKDKFGNELTTANTQANSYTVTATKSFGPGNLTGTTATITSTRGVARFDNLRVSDSSGVHRITFTATVTATTAQISGQPTFTTGDYNIKLDQTISFTTTAPTTARVSGVAYTPQASSSVSLPVTITVDPSSVDANNALVCSISGGIVSFLKVGTCVLNANQAGNSTYFAASQVQQIFNVAEARLGTPQAPTVTATANTLKSLEVSWPAVTDAVKYTVKVYEFSDTNSSAATVLDITATSKRITVSEFPAIKDSTQYYVSVIAIATTEEGNSPESQKTLVTTNSPAVAPTITSQPAGASRTAGQSVTFTVTASRTDAGVLSYQWRKDGSDIAGATSSTLTRNSLATGDAGSYTVVVTNSLNGTTSTANSSPAVLTVAPTLVMNTPSTGLAATVNSAYTLTLSASGGSTPRTFATASTLPTGITLSSAGVLSGTPTQSGTFAITAVVTDANGATASSSSFNLVVAAAPGLVATFGTPVSAISGQTDRLTVQILNYDPAYTWSGTATIGTVSVSGSGLVTITGVSSGQATTATITASRQHYLTATSTVSATLTAFPIISYNASDLNGYATDSVVRDLSGRGNHATAVNTIGLEGPSGAWNFTGGTNSGGDYVDLPDLQTNLFSNGITIDFEANFGSATAWERIIDFGKGIGANLGPQSDNLVIGRSDGSNTIFAQVYRGNSQSFGCSANALENPSLHRWTVFLSSSSCVIMRNGTTLVSTAVNASVSPNITWSSNFIGRSNWSANSQFDGQIRSLRIYAGTPSFAQIGAFSYKTVTYNSNGGSAVPATARGTTSGELLLPGALTRTGFTFTGWYDSTNTVTRTKIGDAGARYAPTSDIQLFAGWEAIALTVTFETNSGTAVTAATTRAGESLTGTFTTTRAGYTFAGWFDNQERTGSPIVFPYVHNRDINFTLYAEWTANEFNVTFVTNSGTAVTAFTTRTAGSLPNSFTATRAGYTFAGWYLNNPPSGSPIVFPYAHGQTGAFTLYAGWTANDLNVSFATYGGSAVTAVVTRTGDSILSAPPAPTLAGYNLVGWFDNEARTGSAITFPYTHGKTDNFTLHAKWEAKTLTVSFNSGGGSSVSSITTQTAASISSAPTPPTRAGYNFLGWVEEGDSSATVISFPYTHGKTADFTLFAKWDAKTLTMTFDSRSGVSVSSTTTRTGDTISATVTTTRTGYTFAGWFVTEARTGSAITFPYTHGQTANFTLYAEWTPNTLNVTFDTNSGTAVTATTTRTGEALTGTFTTTRAGYTFAGWFNKPDLTGSQASFPYTHGQTGNFILYAKWTANTLNVKFERNDSTTNFVIRTTTTGGEVTPPPTDPTYRGFEFLGWSETPGGSILSFPYVHGRTGDFTLHGVWKAGNYTVVYQYNGATGGNTLARQAYTTDIARTGIALPVPTRTAYTFGGWFSDISLDNPLELENNGRFVPTANQTIYAKWVAVDYTVTYHQGDAQRGTPPVDSRLYNTGQTVSLLANSGLLARDGYRFVGWVTSPTGQGSELNSGQTVNVVASNINFYPKWAAITYSISYNLNGGSGNLSSAPTSWVVNTTVNLPTSATVTRTGYDFGGWSRTVGGAAVTTPFTNNFVDESLSAIWTLKSIPYSFAAGGASSGTISRWPANGSANFGSELTLPDLEGEVVTIDTNRYLFFGWGDGSATYRSGHKFVLTETSPQFTAQWVKLLDVRYSFGGGTKSVNDTETTDADAECITNSLCVPNQEITLRGAPTRLGYTFGGWKAQSTSETIIRNAGSKTVIREDNYLFFAEWTPVDYTFSFNSLGGSISNANQIGNIGRVLTLPDPGTRTGYTFGGWSPDLGTTKFAAGPSYVVGSASISFDAVWIPDVYQIAFDWQGGVGSPQANSSFTVGRGPMTLPAQGDRVKDGYSFAGWSTTPGGEVVSNYEPTASGLLFAKWVDGNYAIDFNAQNGPTPVTQVLVQRTTSTILRTPTRPNFRLIGWFDALTGGNFVGKAGERYLPTASKTLYARWVQSSFYGVDEAALETASIYTASGANIDETITHNPSGSQARIQIPGGTLPNGTVISVRYFKDDTRQRELIGNYNNYFFSVVVSWLFGTGATATVPETLPDGFGGQKPITVTLTNSQIKAGAMVYRVIDGAYTPLQRASVDGSITVRIYSDPELVVAATPPTAPRNVLVVGPGRASSTVSWLAPASNGGSPVTDYDVFLDNVLACASITVLSCDLTNLSDSSTFAVRVVANNAVGIGEAATTSFTTAAPPTAPAGSGGGPAPAPVAPVNPVVPPAPAPVKPPVAPPVAPPPPVAPAAPPAPPAPPAPSAPSDSSAAPAEPETDPTVVDDDAPGVPFDPLATPEGVEALTDSLGNAAAAVGAIAAAAAAAAAAAGAAGGGSGGSGGSGSGGQGNQGGSIATIDAAHERFVNRRRGRGDKWKIWKKKWLSFSDKFSIATVVKSAKFSPLFSKIAVDGAYLRAAFGSLGLLPTVAAAAISVMTVSMNEGAVLTPQWQWFIVLAVIGIFDAFAGLVGTLIFVAGTVVMHGGVSSMDDVRLLLGVIIVGYGPALLANAFRAFRKEPEEGEEYWYERLVDLVVLPFIGGWVTATMISILPALAGTTMAVANHVNEFAIAIAIAITIRVVFEEFVGRWFPARLDTLHPTDVDDPKPYQKWISVTFRLAVFVFVTAALMGNVWQVWVGSALFILPTILGFYAHRFRNFPWIWRIMPTGIPGLAFALIVASITTSIVSSWFGSTPDLALWSFALLPIPMLGIAILAMIGREGNEGEVRWTKRPGFKWVYRIGGAFMLLATMDLAGVIELFPF
jgi:uncharacterized repeat protein (TIGR02543 family)